MEVVNKKLRNEGVDGLAEVHFAMRWPKRSRLPLSKAGL